MGAAELEGFVLGGVKYILHMLFASTAGGMYNVFTQNGQLIGS